MWAWLFGKRSLTIKKQRQHILKNARPFPRSSSKSIGIAGLTFTSFGTPFSSTFPPLDSDIFSGSAIPKLGPSCIIFSPCHDASNLFRMACRAASILSVLSWFCISSSSIFLRQTSGSISKVRGMQDMCSDMGELTREEGLSHAVCVEEVANSKLLSPIPNAPMVTLTHSTTAGPLVKRLFCCQGNPQAPWRLHSHMG